MALDFSVQDSAIVHLDYNSTSIGLDFGNGPVRVRKIVITPDEDHTTHRISENTIELYTGTTNYQYEQIQADEFVFEKDENGIITIALNDVIENRYFKLNVLFDERDKTFDPIDNAEFINTLTAMLAVYSEATSRAEEYEYDSAGNRTLERITLVQTDEYSSYYYENSNRLKTDGKYAFVYDAAGNMVEKAKIIKTIKIKGSKKRMRESFHSDTLIQSGYFKIFLLSISQYIPIIAHILLPRDQHI